MTHKQIHFGFLLICLARLAPNPLGMQKKFMRLLKMWVTPKSRVKPDESFLISLQSKIILIPFSRLRIVRQRMCYSIFKVNMTSKVQ